MNLNEREILDGLYNKVNNLDSSDTIKTITKSTEQMRMDLIEDSSKFGLETFQFTDSKCPYVYVGWQGDLEDGERETTFEKTEIRSYGGVVDAEILICTIGSDCEAVMESVMEDIMDNTVHSDNFILEDSDGVQLDNIDTVTLIGHKTVLIPKERSFGIITMAIPYYLTI